ncbi:hypothetical protein SALBM311S_05249 [Streptomyces alboniger]
MTEVSVANAANDGKVDRVIGGVHRASEIQRDAMTAHAATAVRARTGGPREDGPQTIEHLMGWTLVVVIAMLVTQLGLL